MSKKRRRNTYVRRIVYIIHASVRSVRISNIHVWVIEILASCKMPAHFLMTGECVCVYISVSCYYTRSRRKSNRKLALIKYILYFHMCVRVLAPRSWDAGETKKKERNAEIAHDAALFEDTIFWYCLFHGVCPKQSVFGPNDCRMFFFV